MAFTKRSKSLYKLTDGDRAIFQAARERNDLSLITNFYMRSEDSGTYWRHVSDEDLDFITMPEAKTLAQRWHDGYDTLHAIWEHLRKPDYFGPSPFDPDDWRFLDEVEFKKRRESLETVYRVHYEPGSPYPVFHHPHGQQMIPWQLEMDRARQPLCVVPGGKGSSKTYGKVLSALARAVLYPGYAAISIAPFSRQSEEVYNIALQIIENTIFEKFVLSATTKPRPKIVIGHNGVGRNYIECFSGDDPGKFLTLTLDEAIVDQAEQMDGNGTATIEELIVSLGTRFRGTVRGRSRLGQITFLANSADNPQLWDLVDRASEEPDYIWLYEPNTFENIYLTMQDLIRFEQMVKGKDEQFKKMHFFGARPVGSGEHFPAASMERCRSKAMDDEMDEALRQNREGWVKLQAPRVDIHRWERPKEPGSSYIVAADPGWGNPPDRNAACLGVFKIDDFPRTPAQLIAFDWTFGHGSPNPWIAKYIEYVLYYEPTIHGFDATGLQSGYERLTDIGLLGPTPVNMGAGKKFTYLNLTKNFMSSGLYRFPTITHLSNQFSKYRLPDENIRQDIVSMFFVATALLEVPYRAALEESFGKIEESDEHLWSIDDRYARPDSDRDFPVEMFSVRHER